MMGAFAAALQDFERQYERRMEVFHLIRATETQRSVQEGSSLTGAPGQPVDEGTLRGSFILEHIRRLLSQITTGLEYAPGIEEGIGPHGPITLRSAVGGFHSVGLTILGNQRIVDYSMREAKRQVPVRAAATLSPRRRP